MKLKRLCLLFLLAATASFQPLSTIAQEVFKVAAVEFNPIFKQREQNFPAMEAAVKTASENGAKLILFPEMGTTGYVYGSRSEIAPFVDSIPGVTTAFFEKAAQQYGVYIVVGMPEVDPSTGNYYNSAFLMGPDGLIGKYRKNNLFLLESEWAAQGNLGVPVFDTPLGKIGIIICYDDYYYQSARLASLKGANILAFIASSGRMLDPDPSQAGVHISISDVQQQAALNGLYVVATNRNNIEKNETLGIGVHYLGGASVWGPLGENLGQAPVSKQKGQATESGKAPTILYAEIDPAHYDNKVKDLLAQRRPELYRDIILNMSPRPLLNSDTPHDIHALLVQYEPEPGNINKNKNKVSALLEKRVNLLTNLIVLPEHTLTGLPQSAEGAKSFSASSADIDRYFSQQASLYGSYLVYSLAEADGDKYYTTARLLDPDGKVVGSYRKTHLEASEAQFLSAGSALPVFETEIGRIGILFGGEARFPEASDVLSVRRADIIAMPSAWNGQFGRADALDPDFLAVAYPDNTNMFWYSTAKTAQAYLLVANFVGTDAGYKGSSGQYSLDPVNGYYPPYLAPDDREEVLSVNFHTIAPSHWWTSQQYIIDGRRPQTYVPLALEQTDPCFTDWKEAPEFFVECWQQ
ncbi:nitrilase-related carbon-nitrogen hydrolase [Roseibium sp. RKSG952]|uniref:nitrilase-related carbon-nitrogen hydrolase n=1 Tax=Roseibium sp. RKSG952 TaxID=2529384 RepID=UPI0012BCB173|nr:nitrilase-related carbon-nitrogen hydrolase [Roseibium sp. RKSG952]MTH95378.1 nitrilase [Roseibium sp. RKSG952]